MSKSNDLVNKYGISGALNHLKLQIPPGYLPKILREQKEYIEIKQMIDEVKALCQHQNTRSECIDYHKRDFGTICNECGKILNTNG